MKVNWMKRLAKWGSVLTTWQIGTRPANDPECQAVRDHRETTLLLRAEVNAAITLLIDREVITANEWEQTVQEECRYLCHALQWTFPGFLATDDGMDIDLDLARDTTKDWKP